MWHISFMFLENFYRMFFFRPLIKYILQHVSSVLSQSFASFLLWACIIFKKFYIHKQFSRTKMWLIHVNNIKNFHQSINIFFKRLKNEKKPTNNNKSDGLWSTAIVWCSVSYLHDIINFFMIASRLLTLGFSQLPKVNSSWNVMWIFVINVTDSSLFWMSLH